MRKVIKILGKVIAWLIITLVTLPLLVALLLNVTAIQNFVVHKATEFLSRKLETTVSIDHIRLRAFSKLTAEGVYLQDYEGDTLIYAQSLGANISKTALLHKKFIIGDVSLNKAKIYLYTPTDGEMNLVQIISRLSNKKQDSTASTKLVFRNIKITDSKFKFQNEGADTLTYGVNYGNMVFDHLNISSRQLAIDGGAISMDIRKLSLHDISGMVIKNMSADNLLIDNGVIALDNTKIVTPDSDIRLKNFRMAGTSWLSMSNVLDSVRFDATVKRSTLSMHTLSYFVPSLGRHSDLVMKDIDIVFGGYINDFRTTVSFESADEITNINAEAAIRNVMNIPAAAFDIDIRELTSNGRALKGIINGFITDSLPKSTADMLSRAGNLSLTAKAAGSMRRFNADADMRADIGDITIQGFGGMPKGGNTYFDAYASVSSLAAGKLLDNAMLGNVTVSAKANGSIGKNLFDINGTVNIPSAEFNGYTYTGINASGSYEGKKVDASIMSGDPKLEFAVNGSADFSLPVPYYDVDLDLRRADLHALSVNKKDTLSILSTRLVAKGSGSNLDNINGQAIISNLEYHSSTDNVKADTITLTGHNDEESRFLAMNSSYADVVFKSDIGYNDIIDYLKHILYDYVPALDNDAKTTAAHHHGKTERVAPLLHIDAPTNRYAGIPVDSVNDADTTGMNAGRELHSIPYETRNNSELHINIKKANNIAAIFLPGFSIAEGTKADFIFDPVNETFSVQAKSDYIEYDKFFVTRLSLNADNTTENDAVIVKFMTENLYLPSFSMPSNNITATVRDNHIDVTARLSNNTTDLNAFIDVKSLLSRSEADDKLTIGLLFDPSSYLMTGPKRWDISSDSIQYSPARIAVRNFKISSEQQSLVLDGIMSSHKSDTLKLELDNFSVRPINALMGLQKIAIDGSLDGYAELVSGMKDPVMIADIRIDSLSTDGYVSGPLQLNSNWDFTAQRAMVSLKNLSNDKNIIQGFYRPDTNSYFANVDIDKVPIAAAAIFLPEDLVSDIDGMAAILLQVRGGKGMPRIDGTISVDNFAATVDITKVRYGTPTLDVDIDNNIANIASTILKDPQGNKAEFTAKADIRNTSNISYDARLVPDNLMVLNTGPKDNDQFYGKVYVSGAATLHGSRSGVNIDVTATTQENSELYLPLSNKSSISEVDWITFENTSPAETPEDILAQKKQEYEKALRSTAKDGEKTNVNLNVSLNVTPGILLSIIIPSINSELSARGSAALDIQMNPGTGDMSIFGTYEVADGDFFFSLPPLISNKKFSLQPGGTIQLSGNPMDAKLNVEALYRLRASLQPIASSLEGLGISATTRVPVECLIRISDNLTHPDLSFDVRVPSADAEIQSALNSILSTSENTALNFITLVALGSFSPDNNADNITGNAKGGASSLGIDFLTNQLSNLISNKNLNVMFRYRAADEITSDELDFGFSYNLGGDRLILEVEGNYDLGNNNTTQNASNMSGDASITWLLTPSGNLRLKGFTRTINRYDENQGMQENGVGIYYKEDFNVFRDIITQSRLRQEMRRKKRENKAAEAALQSSQGAADNATVTRTPPAQPINKPDTTTVPAPVAKPDEPSVKQNSIERRRAMIEEERRRWREEREKQTQTPQSDGGEEL